MHQWEQMVKSSMIWHPNGVDGVDLSGFQDAVIADLFQRQNDSLSRLLELTIIEIIIEVKNQIS